MNSNTYKIFGAPREIGHTVSRKVALPGTCGGLRAAFFGGPGIIVARCGPIDLVRPWSVATMSRESVCGALPAHKDL
jgi:hypothetical protein